jgi:hypothetical protein
MIRIDDRSGPWGRSRKPGCRPPVGRRTHPALEVLEARLTPSSGGWISSIQSGQTGDGLLGQYYNNPTLSGTPSFDRWDNLIDFSATGGNSYPGGAPGPGFSAVGPGGWSARWTGVLTTSVDEPYTFSINSSGDGVRLWVTPVGQQQGSPLIDDWTGHGQVNDTATVTLKAGQDYTVEMDATQASSISQQLGLQWSSPSTPLEDIAPVTQVGLNVDGLDSLFANLVNGGTRSSWDVPTDSNDWPENDAQILLAEGDTSQQNGGAYLVQFNGLATVSYNNGWAGADWLVNGVDLHSPILQAGQGYDSATNTTTATMVIPPNPFQDMYITFANTRRDPGASSDITSISEVGTTVTVSLPSVAGIVPDQTATISGLAGYNGSFLVTGVNPQANTFTFTSANSDLPSGLSGGSASFAGNGITNLYVMQPSTQGGSTPLPVGTLFTPAALAMASQFSTLRLMGLEDTNANLTSDWSDRTLVSDNFWSGWVSNSGAGVNTGVLNSDPNAGVPWEIQVALANETGKDIYINIPSNASIEYINNLADLFAYGSDGVTPYTSVQADPIWKPLDSNLKVYIEFSNETWNSGFTQAETRSDGWINQLSQRALHDYLTGDLNDPLYPGGGSNAYDDGAILASVPGVIEYSGPASYNADPAPSTDGGSPYYFAGTDFGLGEDWVGLRDAQISDAFKATFGEADIAAADPNSRVRPVYEWQGGANLAGGLAFIDSAYGAEHPVNYYLYGGGAQWYSGNGAEGFSDVLFTDPAFSGGLYGWSSSGSAGVVSNGSTMGNPDAPPAFSAINVTGSASESGNLVTITTTSPHDFATGESINVTTATPDGYDGTFTVESATPDSFTYFDPTSGLADSGDDVVTVNAGSSLAAYLQPGADISQEVTFSGGYADITLYACQTVSEDWAHGLSITLTPTDGGPAINGGQPINVSQGSALFSGSQGAFAWDCSEAFYTGDKPYTYAVTFTSTLPSGTVFLADPAIQTVNGLFDETTAASLNISGEIQLDDNLALEYGMSEVGYEGGYYFDGNLSVNGYAGVGGGAYSSAIPNVDMYANLDPRTEQLAVDTLDEFYSAGGTLPIMFESSFNPNSWALAAPYYFDWDTPKVQAAVSVEQAAQPATDGLTPGSVAPSDRYWLTPGGQMSSTWLVPTGSYSLTVWFGPGNETAVGQTDPVEILINGQVVATEQVPVATGGVFTIPVGSLSAGQYSVGLTNDAPVGNGNLGVGGGGAPVYSLIEVARAATTLEIDSGGGVYDGSPLPALGSVAGVGGVPGASLEGVVPILTYYAGSIAAGTPLAGPPSAVGTYTVTAFFPGSADFAPATTQATFTIGQATPTVLVADTSRLYDGSPLSILALVAGASGVAGASLEGVAPVLTYYAGGAALYAGGAAAYADGITTGTLLVGPPTAVGTYTVTAVFPGSADYASATMQVTFTITIGRATPTVLVADAGGVYDGSSFPASASVMGASGVSGASLEGVAPVLTYYAGGAALYAPLAGPPTAAGTYTVTAAFPGSVDYASATTRATFTIGRATPSILVADAGGVYDGSTLPGSASVAGVGGVSGASLEGVAPVLTYYAGGDAAGTPLAGPPAAVGTYTVTAAFPGSVDYASATTQATFTIGRATPTIGDYGFEQVSVGAGSYDYDPTGSAWTFSGAGIAGNGSGFTSGNPNAPQGSQVAFLQNTGSITQSVAGWAAGSYTLSFDAATRTNWGGINNFEVLVDGKVVGTYEPTTASYQTYTTNVFTVTTGTHVIEFLGINSAGGDDTDFLDNLTVAFTSKVLVADTSLVYDGSPLPVSASVVGDSGVLGASLEGVAPVLTYYAGGAATGTPLAGPPTVPGTYTVTAVFPGSVDYAPATTQATFTIGQATPTVLVADAGGVYDGSSFSASASVAGASGVSGASLEGVALVLTYYAGGAATGTPLAGPPTAVGTYTVTASFPGSVDYAPATTQASFTIGRATPTIGDPDFSEVSVGAGNYVYDPTGSAWTFNGAGIAGNGSAFTSGNPNAPQGSQLVFLQSAGSITQSVAGWAAGSYTISFDAAARGNWGGLNNFEVLIDGTVVGNFEPTTTSYQIYTTNAFSVTAGAHTIEFLGINTAGGDDTDFLDAVSLAVVQTSVPTVGDSGFEALPVGYGNFKYDPTGSAWTFSGGAGVSGNNSAFTSGNPAAPQGSQVGLVQDTGSITQSVAGWAAGSYVISFDAAQRGNYGTSVENFEVLVDGNVVGSFQPNGTSYQTYTTSSFTLSAGAHTIEFLGLDSAGGDNTVFLDAVAVAMANPPTTSTVGDSGFENAPVGYGNFQYNATGSVNSSTITSGNAAAPQGSQVGLVQDTGSITQSVAGWAAGSHAISFDAAQRGNDGPSVEDFEAVVDGDVGTFHPTGTSHQTSTTSSFREPRGKGDSPMFGVPRRNPLRGNGRIFD